MPAETPPSSPARDARELAVSPLEARAYAPYGSVIEALGGGGGRPVNQGTALRFDRLASIVNLRPQTASLNVAVFRCTPRTAWPLPIALLERHAGSTQVFLPMNAARYLVIVAGGASEPDLSTLRAFVASGTQGISYHPGVWHHPLVALDRESDFSCLVHEDDSDRDCDLVRLSPPLWQVRAAGAVAAGG